jgi:5-methylcytosine-specific restriction endonuclease McrA
MRQKNYGLAYQLADEQFKSVILKSSSCAEAMHNLGFSCTTGNSRVTVKRRISELGINIEHWADYTKNAHIATLTDHDKYFAKGTPHSGGHIRERILKFNLLPYECAMCGNKGEWQGKELRLQVDHKNGDHNDNQLHNLRFLCPNCHAQTDTFGGKNVKHK